VQRAGRAAFSRALAPSKAFPGKNTRPADFETLFPENKRDPQTLKSFSRKINATRRPSNAFPRKNPRPARVQTLFPGKICRSPRSRSSTTGGMETAATDDVRFTVGAISISHVLALRTFPANYDRRYGNRRYGWCLFRRRCDFHIARPGSTHILGQARPAVWKPPLRMVFVSS